MSQLFNSIVFGPVKSRRFGRSLGINLLPLENKVCNFNCIYCECGWTDLKAADIKYFSSKQILNSVETRFKEIAAEQSSIDCITFAGNGEPTMHPQFSELIDAVIVLRNMHLPGIKIAVLSNSSLLSNQKVYAALKKVDLRVLKLDAGSDRLFKLINQPHSKKELDWYIQKLKSFDGQLIIQTIFLKGKLDGVDIDNTQTEEVELWIKALNVIKPQFVMIYTIDRDTPATELEKIPVETLDGICKKVIEQGIKASVYT